MRKAVGKKFMLFGLALTALFLLAACGGGGSTESSPSGNTVMSGNVVNGPLAGATVEFFNTDGQSVGTTTTDSNGFYEHRGLPSSANGYRVVASNGFLNGVPYPGALIARCEASPCGVTPLTTAVEKLAGLEPIEYANAHQQLFDWLGLEEDPFIAAHQNKPVPGVDLDSVRTEIRENPEGVTGWVAQLVEEVLRGGTPPENLKPVTSATDSNTMSYPYQDNIVFHSEYHGSVFVASNGSMWQITGVTQNYSVGSGNKDYTIYSGTSGMASPKVGEISDYFMLVSGSGITYFLTPL